MESRDDQRRGGGNPAPATTYIILSRSGAGYLGSYHLADIRGTDVEREAGIDAAREAFRIAEVARSRSVQRALAASAARAAARDPELAELVVRHRGYDSLG